MLEISARAWAELAVSALIAAGAAYLLYRRTTPSTSRRLRIGLGVGRGIVIFLVLLLAVNPVIWLSRTESSEPVIVILVDDSASMTHPTASAKLDAERAILSSGFIQSLEDKAAVRTFTFSDRVEEVGPAELPGIRADGMRTDLVSGLEFAMESLEQLPSDIVIMSDGGVNYGKDAVHYCMGLGIPVHTISMAETEPTADLSIDRLETSERAYAGSELPVEIYLSGSSEGSIETRLAIRDSAGTVYDELLRVPGGRAKMKTTARVKAGETGLHRFTVSLDPFDGEEVTKNNEMTFSLRVIKGKINVCIIAPGPSWDFAFTRRNLSEDPNVETFVCFTDRGAGSFNLPGVVGNIGEVPDLDVVVVLKGSDLSSVSGALRDFVSSGGGLLVAAAGRGTASLGDLSPILAAAGGRAREVRVAPVVTETGIAHEIMNIGGTFRADLWADLPPLPLEPGVAGTKREASVLMRSEKEPDIPVLAVMKYGRGKVCALSLSELWRWDLATVGLGLDVPVYRGLLGSMIKWLAVREETRRVSLTSPGVDYLSGEPVDLVARVVDENLKGLPEAAIEGEIVEEGSGEVVAPIGFDSTGPGNFTARTDFLPAGRYVARARASLDGNPLGADALEFSVDSRGLEDVSFDGDDILLGEVSSVTGGGHYDAAQAGLLAAELNPGEVVVNKLDEVRFQLGLGTFGLIFVLLGLEWLLRKRRMLP
jgi:hypothetical protein